jgi:hypothetical protein
MIIYYPILIHKLSRQYPTIYPGIDFGSLDPVGFRDFVKAAACRDKFCQTSSFKHKDEETSKMMMLMMVVMMMMMMAAVMVVMVMLMLMMMTMRMMMMMI